MGLVGLLEHVVTHASSHAPLSWAAGRMSDWHLPRPVMGALVKGYCRALGVDRAGLDRAPDDYECLNAFFARGLAPGRELPGMDGAATVVSPVDGVLQDAGSLEGRSEFLVKQQRIGLKGLTGEDLAEDLFRGGSFALVYLSPRHYHRVHAPADGTLTGYRYLPGRFFPVNRLGMEHAPGMFMRNERVTLFFDTASGPVWLCMVGASFVGRMTVACDGFATNQKLRKAPLVRSLETPLAVQAGDEVGRFNLGSSVVLLSAAPASAFGLCQSGEEVRLGDLLWRFA